MLKKQNLQFFSYFFHYIFLVSYVFVVILLSFDFKIIFYSLRTNPVEISSVVTKMRCFCVSKVDTWNFSIVLTSRTRENNEKHFFLNSRFIVAPDCKSTLQNVTMWNPYVYTTYDCLHSIREKMEQIN